MAFDESERERIRYHAGYLEVSPAASLSFGQPVPQQTLFLIESAMNLILQVAEDRVRRILNVLDNLECKMIEGQDFLPASRLGDMEIRPDHIDQLDNEYYRWAGRMVDILGVPFYPYSNRFKRRVSAGNLDVM